MTTDKKSFWSEIRSDYIQEDLDAGFIAIVIDAWRTTDDNEEGCVIAKVFGKMVKHEPVVFVDYLDYIALKDPMASEIIADSKKRMLEMLLDQNKK